MALTAEEWAARHRILRWFLALHLPALTFFGLAMSNSPGAVGLGMLPIVACLGLGVFVPHRWTASFFTTAGIVYCAAALVALSHGRIEAHFHFFVIIGFIALYQDWVPFLWNIAFTVLSHGIGSVWETNLIFNHPAGQQSPWVGSARYCATRGLTFSVAGAGPVTVLMCPDGVRLPRGAAGDDGRGHLSARQTRDDCAGGI